MKRHCQCLAQLDQRLQSGLPLSLKLSQTFLRQPDVQFRPQLSGDANGSEKTSVNQDHPPAGFNCFNNRFRKLRYISRPLHKATYVTAKMRALNFLYIVRSIISKVFNEQSYHIFLDKRKIT